MKKRSQKATTDELHLLKTFLVEQVRDRLEGTLRMRIPLGTALRDIEREVFRQTLAVVGGNVTKCAEALKIDRRTAYRYLQDAESAKLARQRQKRSS